MQTYAIETRALDEQQTAVEFATLATAEIGPFLGKAFGECAAYLARKGAGPVGLPFARYRDVGGGQFEIEAGFVATTPVSGEGDVEPSDLPRGTAAVTVHVGPYDAIAPAYVALGEWVRDQGGEPNGDPWEVYLTDPSVDPDPSSYRTEVVMPYTV